MDKRKLYVLWTTGDPVTSQFMIMMYATYSKTKRWWDEVCIIIWGASAKLVSEDENIKQCVKNAMQAGVEFSACIACATQLGVVDKLKEIGIEVKPWGEPLSDIIKEDEGLITI